MQQCKGIQPANNFYIKHNIIKTKYAFGSYKSME